jgi:hypothetical protein
MDSTYSKHLIVKPEDSFAGASQITYTTLSGLALWYEAVAGMVPTGTTTVSFQDRVPGAQFAHVLKLEPEKTDAAQTRVIWQKFFCHALISRLPEVALPEAEERLVEIFEDYVPKRAAPNVAGTLSPQVLIAEQGRRHPRPEIELEE